MKTFKKQLVFLIFYILGFTILYFLSKNTNLFHFSAFTYITAFFLGMWERETEYECNKYE